MASETLATKETTEVDIEEGVAAKSSPCEEKKGSVANDDISLEALAIKATPKKVQIEEDAESSPSKKTKLNF